MESMRPGDTRGTLTEVVARLIHGQDHAATGGSVGRVFGIPCFKPGFLTATEWRPGCPIGNDVRGLAVLAVPAEAGTRRCLDTGPVVRAGTFACEVLEWRPTVGAAP
jgi:hypothetical protein